METKDIDGGAVRGICEVGLSPPAAFFFGPTGHRSCPGSGPSPVNSDIHRSTVLRLVLPVVLLLTGMAMIGCATVRVGFSPADIEANSPRAQRVAPLDAYILADQFAKANVGTDYMVGTGESMMPLYRDHSVLIVRFDPISTLRPGMTVVFVDERGKRVAHALVRQQGRGWITKGIGNSACDMVGVTEANYVGVVVKVFEPAGNPMLALIEEDRLARAEAGVRLAMGR